jgi:hypothetical protein
LREREREKRRYSQDSTEILTTKSLTAGTEPNYTVTHFPLSFLSFLFGGGGGGGKDIFKT